MPYLQRTSSGLCCVDPTLQGLIGNNKSSTNLPHPSSVKSPHLVSELTPQHSHLFKMLIMSFSCLKLLDASSLSFGKSSEPLGLTFKAPSNFSTLVLCFTYAYVSVLKTSRPLHMLLPLPEMLVPMPLRVFLALENLTYMLSSSRKPVSLDAKAQLHWAGAVGILVHCLWALGMHAGGI